MEEEHHEARVSKLENFALRFERVSKFEEVTFPDCRDPITLGRKTVFHSMQNLSSENRFSFLARNFR